MCPTEQYDNNYPDAGTYQDAANKETWAFNLFWQNDRPEYDRTLDEARRLIASRIGDDVPLGDYALGDHLINFWHARAENELLDARTPVSTSSWAFKLTNEVGSWWRIDRTEVGFAIRDALGVED